MGVVSEMQPSVVFDCMIFLQALGRSSGPSKRCFELLDQGQIILHMSNAIQSEIADVLSRPSVLRKFPDLAGPFAQQMLSALWTRVRFTPNPPKEQAQNNFRHYV